MKRAALAIATLMFIATGLLAQPRMGSVAGTVQLSGGSPAAGAMVQLSGVDGSPAHDPHFHAHQITPANGTFQFPMIPPGAYTVSAGMHMAGFAAAVIEVLSEQTTNVTLTLQPRDTSEHPHDSLTIVELEGTAIVVHPDTLHPLRTAYFLDVDADGTPDYRLAFGPPWYNPPSGATRPLNGDQITIVGGLLGLAEPPTVAVFEINGLTWRDPHNGHGGFCGNEEFVINLCEGHHNESDPDEQQNPQHIELMGTIEMDLCLPVPHNVNGVYQFRSLPDYRLYNLNFGADMAAPPAFPGEMLFIMGALVPSRGHEHDDAQWVVPYEYSNQFWREPGDTISLVAMSSAEDPVYVGEPVSHLIARNYPNPFNPITTISYSIPTAGNVELKVFDITGREVASLVNTRQSAGSYAVAWDGSAHPTGIYFYRLTVGNLSFTNRMVLMK